MLKFTKPISVKLDIEFYKLSDIESDIEFQGRIKNYILFVALYQSTQVFILLFKNPKGIISKDTNQKYCTFPVSFQAHPGPNRYMEKLLVNSDIGMSSWGGS